MNWFKKAQSVYAYHGTDEVQILKIKQAGLHVGAFFASNESDISQYADGFWLRFPFPQNKEEVVGMGDYYKTLDHIPIGSIEYKTDTWGEWKEL